MKHFVTFGETMVQYNAEYEGSYRREGPHIRDVAGAESNVAVNIRKLLPETVETTWVSRLGDDDAGKLIQNELHGRTLIRAQRFEGEFTGTSHLNHYGDHHVKTYNRRGSAASALSFAEVEPHLSGADILHVTGITPILSETCRNTTIDALTWARHNNLPVSFDVNYREPLWPPKAAKATLDTIIDKTTIFKVGHDEAEIVWARGLTATEYAKYFFKGNVQLVIVTRSSNGSVVYDGTNFFEHPGYPIEVADPVGAGDAFVAGILAGILEHYTIHEFFSLESVLRQGVLSRAIGVGNVCGALVCTRHGDTSAMPNMGQVIDFFNKSTTKTIIN